MYNLSFFEDIINSISRKDQNKPNGLTNFEAAFTDRLRKHRQAENLNLIILI